MSANPHRVVEALLDGSDDPKDYAYDRVDQPDGQFTVVCSAGSLHVDITTGRINGISNPEHDPNSSNIDRFDVNEYNNWLRTTFNEFLEDDDTVDMLFIGYWLKDGSYQEPEHEARSECVELWKNNDASKLRGEHVLRPE